ncbi:MAG: RNA polymerase sigma factor [Gammaproteobacteria bacterium]|nr:RNA polymerase sigma factor [Gammaproteobacteria bacterium]
MAVADEVLVAKSMVDRDTRAFDALVRRYQSRVRGWLRHLAGDAALADDLAQETFMQAWRKLATFRSKGSFEAWLLTIARNQFLQNRRKVAREAGHLTRLKSETDSATLNIEADRYEGEENDVERYMEVLNHDERNVMILVYGVGLSHGETSKVSGLPLGTVKSHIRRSVGKIREQFKLESYTDDEHTK